MNKVLPIEILNLYYYFQCFTSAVNYFLLFGSFFWADLAITDGFGHSHFISDVMIAPIVVLDVLFLNFLFNIIVISATDNLRNNKPLTKIQKFSSAIYIILTLPLYSCIIWLILDQLQNNVRLG